MNKNQPPCTDQGGRFFRYAEYTNTDESFKINIYSDIYPSPIDFSLKS